MIHKIRDKIYTEPKDDSVVLDVDNKSYPDPEYEPIDLDLYPI